jgi:hypothetical protein
MTRLDNRPPLTPARSARVQRAFEGIVASYIRDISGRGARRDADSTRVFVGRRACAAGAD